MTRIAAVNNQTLAATDGMTALLGGEFTMGSDVHYADERPARTVRIDAFSIETSPVTNDAFAEFIDATGYVTVAERDLDPLLYPGAQRCDLVPGSLVFRKPTGPVRTSELHRWWHWTPTACWRHPLGPDSDVTDLAHHPVVHIAHEDADAYARWMGRRLPTEAEWEYAARGGLETAEFAWGDVDSQDSDPLANTWQSLQEPRDDALSWIGTTPVGAYPANGHGLLDMIGNVWEWTSDWYQPGPTTGPSSCCSIHNQRDATPEDSLDPATPETPIPRKVLKGGSFLCNRRYCFRYRPAARQPQMIDTSLSNCGFRCAADLAVNKAGLDT